jgi:multidrug transporter EmrE-like cation transporter
MSYSFGVPGYAVWTSHIVIGIFLVYVGWVLYEKKRIDRLTPIVLIVLGVLAALYHAHIWWVHENSTHKKKH